MKELNKKLNTLTTSVENTKTDLAYQEKVKKTLENDKDIMEKEKETLNRKMGSKEDEMKDKVKEIEDLKILLRKKDVEF